MRKIFISAICILVFAAISQSAFAQGIRIDPLLRPENAPTISGQADESALEYEEYRVRAEIIRRVSNIILGLAGIVAIYFIITNSWFLILAAGSEEKITQHKKGIAWALLGLVFIILSYSIIRFIVELPFTADQPKIEQPVPIEQAP